MAISYAILAYFAEFISRILAQLGFLLQKVSMREYEQKQLQLKKKNKDVDDVGMGKSYCQVKWIIGFSFVILQTIVQACVLPFVDLTLISCNCAVAIVANMIFAVKILDEKFVWQYDLTAMVLIIAGTLSILLLANREEETFTGEEITELLLTWRTFIYVALSVFFLIIHRIGLKIMIR